MKNKAVQLITYADSLGADLSEQKYILDKYLKDVITGVHILPFYPSSADRGFAPLTHREVDAKFGTQNDIKAIAQNYDLMADLIVNHISSDSKHFQDFLEKGKKSKYHNFFLNVSCFSRKLHLKAKTKTGKIFVNILNKFACILRRLDLVFHKNGVSKLALKKVYRPRQGSPFIKFKFKNGKSQYLWCTFSPDQIDLNIHCPAVRKKYKRDIEHLSKLGVKYLRLDAVAYVGKKRGTNSFLIPETIKFIKWLASYSHKHNMLVIPEVHFDYEAQLVLAQVDEIDYVYDFALPFLMLHSIYNHNTKALKNWLKIRPDNSISNLDTHDGIGVIDVKNLLSDEEIEKTSQEIYKRSGDASQKASGINSTNADTYQINSSYYSTLEEKDQPYLLARAIQVFLPGIPQIYYVGLLAGKNDVELLNKTKIGRDINRHYYTKEEVRKNLDRQVVKRLFALCKLRNTHPAFSGEYSLIESLDNTLEIKWKKKNTSLHLKANFDNYEFSIYEDLEGVRKEIGI